MSGTVGVVRQLAERRQWLGQPLFFAAVATLVVNDHVLKHRFPGWWTGKLSDIAGVVVVGVLASVVLGATRGLVLTALAFGILKTVPGFAEAVGPVLGGLTARDHTDLLAVVALVPTWWLLRGNRPSVARSIGVERLRNRLREGTVVSSVLPLIGVVFAVFACTATSCPPRPAVIRVVARGHAVFAEIDRGLDDPEWARSDDGGRTWNGSDRPSGVKPDPKTADPFNDSSPRGPVHACAADGSCYQLSEQQVIERTSPDGSTTRELVLTGRQFDAVSTGCAGAHRGVLSSVTVADTSRAPAVASFGADGVVVRDADGHWIPTRVLGVGPKQPAPHGAVGLLMGFLFPTLAIGVWFLCRRIPAWRTAAVVAMVGWFVVLMIATVVSMSDPNTGDHRAFVIVMPLGQLVAAAIAIAVGCRRTLAPPPRPIRPPPPIPPTA